MTLPGSGIMHLSDIREEIYGVGYTAQKSLGDCVNDASPSVGSPPISMSAFYGHTQNWGRCYSDLNISYTAYIERITHGGQYLMTSGIVLKFTGDRDESCAVYKDTSQTTIGAGEGITLKIYYRIKQMSNAWNLLNTYNSYTSFSFALAFSNYDYKLLLEADP